MPDQTENASQRPNAPRGDAIERAAWVMWRADGEPTGVAKRDPYRKLARALAGEGLLVDANEPREQPARDVSGDSAGTVAWRDIAAVNPEAVPPRFRDVAPAVRRLFGLKLPAHIHTGQVCDEGKLWCAKHDPQLSSEWTSDLDELRAFLRDHAHPTDAEVDRCHESTDFAHTCRVCQAPPVERRPGTVEEAGRG